MKKMWPESATTSAQLSNYTANPSAGGNNYQFVTRGDHDVSDKQHIMGRYSWWDNINLAADPLKNGVCAEGECTEHYRMHNFVLDDTYTINAKTMMDLRLSYGRYGYVREPLDAWGASDIASIGWPSAYASLVEFPGPAVFVVGSWDAYNLFSGQGADSTIIDYQDTYRLTGYLTRFVGNHTFKLGAEYTVDRFNYSQTNTSSGLWTFNGSGTRNSSISGNQLGTTGLDAASYFTGYVDGGGGPWYDDLTSSGIHYPGVYALDDWRATSKLTVHLGVRWERVGPWTERHDRVTVFSPTHQNDALANAADPVTGVAGNFGLANTTENPNRYGVAPDNMQFSPHVGLSYRIGPNTVINTGYGLFWLPNYLTTNGNPGWDASTGFSTPYVASTSGGYWPTNSISHPFPMTLAAGETPLTSTAAEQAAAFIIYPPGHNLAAFQNAEIGNGPNGDIYKGNYGYTTQWNFGIQQQLGKSTAIDLSYAGSTGIHLPIANGGYPLDRLPDSDLVTNGINCTKGTNCIDDSVDNPYYQAIHDVNPSAGIAVQKVGRAQAQLVPYPEYDWVSTSDPWGQSNYQAMELKVTKRFSQGASINVAYSFDKLESDTDAISSWLEGGIVGASDYNDLKREKSLSSTDASQRLVVAYVYDVPMGRGKAFLPNISRAADEVLGGWGLQGITTLMKGFPVGINQSLDRVDSFGNGGARPNQVSGCQKTVSGNAISKLHGWWNPACYTNSDPFTWGNEPRLDSTIIGPGIANWDLSVVKKFAITADGRVNFQFRAEFYNLFNRVQFGPPNGTFDASSEIGWTQSQNNQPRVAQFALRISY